MINDDDSCICGGRLVETFGPGDVPIAVCVACGDRWVANTDLARLSEAFQLTHQENQMSTYRSKTPPTHTDQQTETQAEATTPMEAAGTTGSEPATHLNADKKPELAPETHSAAEVAQGVGKYRVKPGQKLSHNGTTYNEQEIVELTGVDAEALKDIIERA